MRSSGEVFWRTNSENFSRKMWRLFSWRERPAAMAWPPPAMRVSEHERMASTRDMPSMLRPEPLPMPWESKEMTKVGL